MPICTNPNRRNVSWENSGSPSVRQEVPNVMDRWILSACLNCSHYFLKQMLPRTCVTCHAIHATPGSFDLVCFCDSQHGVCRQCFRTNFGHVHPLAQGTRALRQYIQQTLGPDHAPKFRDPTSPDDAPVFHSLMLVELGILPLPPRPYYVSVLSFTCILIIGCFVFYLTS